MPPDLILDKQARRQIERALREAFVQLDQALWLVVTPDDAPEANFEFGEVIREAQDAVQRALDAIGAHRMPIELHAHYLRDLAVLLRERGVELKREAVSKREAGAADSDFVSGQSWAFYEVLDLMKQASMLWALHSAVL